MNEKQHIIEEFDNFFGEIFNLWSRDSKDWNINFAPKFREFDKKLRKAITQVKKDRDKQWMSGKVCQKCGRVKEGELTDWCDKCLEEE